jgi:hypothetical protein
MCVDSLNTSVIFLNLSLSHLRESAGKMFSVRNIVVYSHRDTFSPVPFAHRYILKKEAVRYAASRACETSRRFHPS